MWIFPSSSPVLVVFLLHNYTVLDSFLTSEPSLCSAVAFPPLRNSVHVVASTSTNFLLSSKEDVPFYCTVLDYSCAECIGLHDQIKDVAWEDNFDLDVAAITEICESVQAGINKYIFNLMYQVKRHLSTWSLATDAMIAHKINLLHLWVRSGRLVIRNIRLIIICKIGGSTNSEKFSSRDLWRFANRNLKS